MKNIKKLTLTILALVIVCSIACVAVACVSPTADTTGNITVVIGEKVYKVDLSKVENIKNLDSVLDYLNKTENVKLDYTESRRYGRYYTQVGTVVENQSRSEYVYIYTTVEKDKSLKADPSTYTYKNVVLTESNVGASSMSILDGCTIVITLTTGGKQFISEEGSFTLLLGETAYDIDLGEIEFEKGVHSVLDYLKEDKNLALTYQEDNDGNRNYSQIGALVPDRDKGEFMRLYTSVANDQLQDESAKKYEYNGIELVESKVGVTGLSIEDGCVIAFILDVYSDNGQESAREGTITVLVGKTPYTVDLSLLVNVESVDDILEYLQENADLTIGYTDAAWGTYLSSIGGVVPDESKNEYVAIYTTVTADIGEGSPYEYNGVTLGYSKNGTSTMSVENGCTILFAKAYYNASMTVVVGETPYTVDLSLVVNVESVDDILEYLQENADLTIGYTESAWGTYLSSIGSVVPDESKNEYVAIYTTVTADIGDGAPYEYEGVTLGYSKKGISTMSVEKDCTILFVKESW